MPAKRKLIKASTVADMLGCHPKTVIRGAFNLKKYPLNPFSIRPTWMFEEKEVRELIAKRERLGK